MDEKEYWHIFLETGAPEAYLLYRAAEKKKDTEHPEGAKG